MGEGSAPAASGDPHGPQHPCGLWAQSAGSSTFFAAHVLALAKSGLSGTELAVVGPVNLIGYGRDKAHGGPAT